MGKPAEQRKFHSPGHLQLLSSCAAEPLIPYQCTIPVKITYLIRVLIIDPKQTTASSTFYKKNDNFLHQAGLEKCKLLELQASVAGGSSGDAEQCTSLQLQKAQL